MIKTTMSQYEITQINYNLELEDRLERAAAELWRRDNPTQSIFACDLQTKIRYRMMVLRKKADESR